MNIVKEQPPLKRPHLGRVPGAGGGRKHVDHGLAVPSTKESRQAEKDREHEALLQKVANLEANMEQHVQAAVESRVQKEVASKVDDAVASRVNEIIPSMVQSISNFFASGGKGPLPVISLGQQLGQPSSYYTGSRRSHIGDSTRRQCRC